MQGTGNIGRHARTGPTTNEMLSNQFNVTGEIGALINAYITYFGKLIEAYGTQIIIGLLLIAIMILAAYMFLKD